MRTLKLPLYYVAFAIGFVFMLSSCQKQNEETLKTNTQSTPTFQSLTEISESGIDIESLEFPESPTPSSDYSTSSRSAGLTFFSDPAAFAADCPDLLTEDFEEGVGFIVGFAGPLDESSSNAVFSPGDILPGVSFNSNTPQGGFELAFVDETAGFGNLGATVVANFFLDAFVINFTASDVTGVGMDVVDIFGSSDVIVEIFGSSGSLGSINVPSTPSGVFLGIMSSEAITMVTIYSPDGGAEGVDNISFGTCCLDVAIDIKPGSDPNSINCNNANALIPVAILSSDTFDATTVDHTTVMFEGAMEWHTDKKTGELKRHEEDVDGDGLMDLVFHFRLSETTLDCNSVSASLEGMTYDGSCINGSDAVNMIGGGE